MKKRLLEDSEIEFLAESYIKLRKNPIYQKMSKSFQDYISEFLDAELITINKMKGVANGK